MTNTLPTQIVALYSMLAQRGERPVFLITIIAEPNDVAVNWSASISGVSGPNATSDDDALRGLRDLLIERCRKAHVEIGAVLPAFEAMQKEEREALWPA